MEVKVKGGDDIFQQLFFATTNFLYNESI